MALHSPTRRNIFSRRTALRTLAVIPAVYAVDTLLSGTASAGGTSTVTTLPGGGTVELIDAVAKVTTTNPAGYVKPDATNTGVRPGTTLETVRGDITVTADNTVIENKDIYGFVKIRAANVVIRNCRVRGSGPGSNNTGLIDCNHRNVRNALIEDCLLVPDVPSIWLDGVIGKEYTARRCHVYNTVDGFGAYNVTDKAAPTNVTIESCYIHDLSFFSDDTPNHVDGTHNDGIQIQGGTNITVRGNTIDVFMSTTAGTQDYLARNIGQGILVQPNVAPVGDTDISYNWIDGGKVGIYYTLKGAATQATGRCQGNRFGRNQYVYNGNSTYQIRVFRGVTFDNALTENFWADNGAAFVESKSGGIRYDG